MKVRICPKCGKHNSADAWYCADKSCGEALSVDMITEIAESHSLDSGLKEDETSSKEHDRSQDIREAANNALLAPTPNLEKPPMVVESQYANFWRRAAAFIIDGVLYYGSFGFLFLVVMYLIAFMPEQLIRFLQLDNAKVGSFFQWGYWTVIPFLVFALPLRVWGGQTVGKKILGIKVVDNLGSALSWGQCVVRPILYLLSMVGLLGFLWSLWDREKRCWHDFMAHTHVVRLTTSSGQIKWYEWVWSGLPILLIVLGARGGAFAGVVAFGVNTQIFRSARSTALKFILTGAVSALAVVVGSVPQLPYEQVFRP